MADDGAGNGMYPLSDAPPSRGFDAKQVIFAHLKVDTSGPALRFHATPKSVLEGDSISETDAQAKAIAAALGQEGWTKSQGPFDIKVTQQCWIILKLDDAQPGWQFANGSLPVSTKTEGQPGDNFGLRHVATGPGGSLQVAVGPVTVDGCKVVYFAVGARRANEPQSFNYHTEFLQTDDAGNPQRMVVIFDPDIPDDGPGSIP